MPTRGHHETITHTFNRRHRAGCGRLHLGHLGCEPPQLPGHQRPGGDFRDPHSRQRLRPRGAAGRRRAAQLRHGVRVPGGKGPGQGQAPGQHRGGLLPRQLLEEPGIPAPGDAGRGQPDPRRQPLHRRSDGGELHRVGQPADSGGPFPTQVRLLGHRRLRGLGHHGGNAAERQRGAPGSPAQAEPGSVNLVVLGADIETPTLKTLAKLTGARGIEQIHGEAFCILDATPDERVAEVCRTARLDYAYVPAGRRLTDFGLFVTDMDSTRISIECIDEIADMYGLKRKVAAITEAAMLGELDFRESVTRRVALLAGLEESALERVLTERLVLNPGAERLLAGLRAVGIHTVLVSGGFTYFTERLKARLGFDEAYANELEVVDGRLTGRVLGDIVDGQAKATHLLRARHTLGLERHQVIAAGDGANDIPMFEAAGFGVAYRAKPVLRAVADCCLDHTGLDSILSLFAG